MLPRAIAKRKICKVGRSCGLGCVPRNHNCKQPLRGQVKTATEWLAKVTANPNYESEVNARTDKRLERFNKRIKSRYGNDSGSDKVKGDRRKLKPLLDNIKTQIKTDLDYLSFVAKGDTKSAQKMVGDQAKKLGYSVGPVYHQTTEDAKKSIYREGFRTDLPNARATDEQVPDGIFFKGDDSDINISDGAKSQIAAFLKSKKPIEFSGREDFFDYIKNSSPDYVKTLKDLSRQDDYYESALDHLENKRDSFKTTSGSGYAKLEGEPKKAVDLIERQIDNLFDTWKKEQALLASKARSILTKTLSEEKGYDLVTLQKDDGGFGQIAENTKIVFNPNQVKSADTITRDSQGRVIPLSKRFDDSVTNIRGNLNPTPPIALTKKLNEAMAIAKKSGDKSSIELLDKLSDKIKKAYGGDFSLLSSIAKELNDL